MMEGSDRMASKPTWTSLSEATKADHLAHEEADRAFAAALPDRVLEHLQGLESRGVASGLPVDRLIHSLQTATRAHRDGRDEEYVVCCLLHDMGDLLAPYKHAELATLILEPFVSEANLFMVREHAIFQGYHFWHQLGFDRNARDKFKDHPHYQHAVEFSEYDQASFDPDYDTKPLEFFEPMVQRLLSRPPKWAREDGHRMTASEIKGLISGNTGQ
jgi:predicted HD phosphohydrolase